MVFTLIIKSNRDEIRIIFQNLGVAEKLPLDFPFLRLILLVIDFRPLARKGSSGDRPFSHVLKQLSLGCYYIMQIIIIFALQLKIDKTMVKRNTTTIGNKTLVDVQDSSNVLLLTFKEEPISQKGSLYVDFHNGSSYVYFNVPRKDFEAIASADSVGKELNSRIISNKSIQYERIR